MATLHIKPETQTLLQQSIVPIILGNGLAAHRLSVWLFFKYRLCSLRCGQQKKVWDHIDPTSQFFRIYRESSGRLAAEQLADLADTYRDCLFVIIPLTKENRSWLSDRMSDLESRFLFADPKHLVCQAPFSGL